jgi:DNA polymerase III psi subunit
MLVKWDILKSIQFELQDLVAITPLEIDMIRMSCRAISLSASKQVSSKSDNTTTMTAPQLLSISASIIGG